MGAKTSSKLFATAVFGDAAGSFSNPGCLIYKSCGMKRLKPSICIEDKDTRVRDIKSVLPEKETWALAVSARGLALNS